MTDPLTPEQRQRQKEAARAYQEERLAGYERWREELKHWLARSGTSQYRLAKEAGLQQSKMWAYLNGKRRPTPETRERIEQAQERLQQKP